MSLLSELHPAENSYKKKKRLGRGKGSGKGGTSTKGHKGQKARKGVSLKPGFEGGSMPLHRRLPKFGFTNKRFKTTYDILNLSQIESLKSDLNPESLTRAGLISGRKKLKILANGKVSQSLNVKAHKFSKKAQELIEKSGGTVEVIK